MPDATGQPAGPAPLRIGIVGAARILPAHLRGMRALRDHGVDGFRVTALCARRIEDAAAFRRPGEGAPPRPPTSADPADPLAAPHSYVADLHPDTLPALYDDWRRMLADDACDAVLVLAPVGLHHRIALDALEAGKHVLLEKPLAVSVRAGRAILAAAARRGLVAGVAEPLRYEVSTRALGWVLRDGLIGEPQLWLSGAVGGEWAPDRIVANTPWRHRKRDAGGGGAIDVGVHLFHLIRYAMGPVAEVSAFVKTLEPERVRRDDLGATVERVRNEVDDVFLANLRFERGAIGSVFWGWGGRGDPTALDLGPAVYGSAGSVRGDAVTLDGGLRGTAGDLYARRARLEERRRAFPLGLRDAFALELLDFLGAVAEGRPMESSAEEGLADLATAFAVLESAEANRPVAVADVLSGAVASYQAEIDAHHGL